MNPSDTGVLDVLDQASDATLVEILRSYFDPADTQNDHGTLRKIMAEAAARIDSFIGVKNAADVYSELFLSMVREQTIGPRTNWPDGVNGVALAFKTLLAQIRRVERQRDAYHALVNAKEGPADQGCSMSGRVQEQLGAHGKDGYCDIRKQPCPRSCLMKQIRSFEAGERGHEIQVAVLVERYNRVAGVACDDPACKRPDHHDSDKKHYPGPAVIMRRIGRDA